MGYQVPGLLRLRNGAKPDVIRCGPPSAAGRGTGAVDLEVVLPT
jgi:hypothetical protein